MSWKLGKALEDESGGLEIFAQLKPAATNKTVLNQTAQIIIRTSRYQGGHSL